jgi:pimeloyl-ACP methyl ester carboxylesterase
MDMREASFNTGKVVLNYAEGPENGPPLVLLHGGSAWWQYFEPILPDLTAHWHVFAPDLRGHGKSGRVSWRYAVRDYAEDIAAFLQEVSGPAFLFGHSLGGIVALMTASLCPETVRAVVVGDSPLDAATWEAVLKGDPEKLRQWRALSGGSKTVEEIDAVVNFHHLAIRLYHQDPDVLGVLLEDYENAAAGYEMEKVLPAIPCPVLLLQADPQMGSAMTDAEVEHALPLLTRPSHVRLAGLSHILFIDNKEAFLAAMEAFLMPLR